VGARLIDSERPDGAWILTCRGSPVRRRRQLERAGVRLIEVRQRKGHLDLRAAWKKLGEAGVNDLLVEGGGGLAAALLRAGLVDRMYLIIAPMLIGSDGRPVLGELGVDRLDRALRPRGVASRKLGDDLLLTVEW
jgi:diaminohydroxyphosphoribosylaminopyrimidine deaminase/5-amino-6-(5-phosphoribosylamino)uracil reductase